MKLTKKYLGVLIKEVMKEATQDIEWEIQNMADYFKNDADELTTKELAQQILKKLKSEKNITVSLSKVLNVLNNSR